MAKVTLTADTWTSIINTTVETAIQNNSSRPITLYVGSTSGVDRDAGIILDPKDCVVFGASMSVSGYIVGRNGIATTLPLKAS